MDIVSWLDCARYLSSSWRRELALTNRAAASVRSVKIP